MWPVVTRGPIGIFAPVHSLAVEFGETSHVANEEESSGNSGRSLMKWKSAIGLMAVAFGFGGSCLAAKAQTTVVIHAGQLFDGKSDRLATKQVIVVQGDR